MGRDLFLVMMEARSLLRAEGYHVGNDRRHGISLSAAVDYAASMLRYGGRIPDDDRKFAEPFYELAPATIDEAFALIDQAAERALEQYR
jgi:hypothetical protein